MRMGAIEIGWLQLAVAIIGIVLSYLALKPVLSPFTQPQVDPATNQTLPSPLQKAYGWTNGHTTFPNWGILLVGILALFFMFKR